MKYADKGHETKINVIHTILMVNKALVITNK